MCSLHIHTAGGRCDKLVVDEFYLYITMSLFFITISTAWLVEKEREMKRRQSQQWALDYKKSSRFKWINCCECVCVCVRLWCGKSFHCMSLLQNMNTQFKWSDNKIIDFNAATINITQSCSYCNSDIVAV